MGRVGTGFPARVSAELLARMSRIRHATPAFANPPRGRDILWADPELVGEIAFENITSDGLFRQASFKGLRLDKDPRQVIVELPRRVASAEKEAAVQARHVTRDEGASRGARRPSVAGIAITNPDKELWPATKDSEAVTKLELARYYEEAAERILKHVANRPISIVRAPDGINGEHFFQRHKLMGAAAPMLAIRVHGEKEPYLGIDNKASLVALAQAGVLEIHPWGSKAGEPDVPERVILDLDPDPNIPFQRVIEGAKELRERLTALDFVPFVKTTGGKGLHVVVAIKSPARRKASWTDAKAFARALAFAMANDSPERYTAVVSKRERTGRIFVDYLRNDRTSTGVAPWSPRAREGATIALPLRWSQLKKGLDPNQFTIASSAALLRKSDPWAELARSARPLPKAP